MLSEEAAQPVSYLRRQIDTPAGADPLAHHSASSPTAGFSDPIDYIVAEMNAHDGPHIPVVSDVANGIRYFPGQSFDHKPAIIARWQTEMFFEIDGEVWLLHHDIWSNIHFGYVNHEAESILPDRVWNFGAQHLPGTGVDNPLDIHYMEAGGSIADQVDGDVTRADVLNYLAENLATWEALGDDIGPQRIGPQ